MKLAVVGPHLSGLPLNSQLTSHGATLVRAAKTKNVYRLFALPGTTPPKPGMIRTAHPTETGIDLEVWDLSPTAFAEFVAEIPPPLGIGTIELADGELVKGFLCESYALATATDITHFGGWRSYLASTK
jgi:allophanate hydrolase